MYIDVKSNIELVIPGDRNTVLTIYSPATTQKTPLLIFLHGFKGFKDWGIFPAVCESFAKKEITVLSFNFRYNGGTVKNPIDFPDLNAFAENTYSKELNDVSLVLNWVRENHEKYLSKVDLNSISVLGHSRGGGIAMLAAEKYSAIKKVITWAAVADFQKRLPLTNDLQQWKEKGVHYIKNGRTKQDMPMNYSFVEDLKNNAVKLSIERALRSLSKPQLIVHGVEDETVVKSDALLLKKWNPDAILELIDNANHTFNGKHPWKEDHLPEVAEKAIELSAAFLLD